MKTFKNREEFQKARLKEKDKLFEKMKNIFSEIALEAHVFGSYAQGSSDEFSDVDSKNLPRTFRSGLYGTV